MLSLVFLLAMFGTPVSQAADLADYAGKPLATYIECGLRSPAVNCDQLINGFFSTYAGHFERVNRRDDAAIRVELTDQMAEGQPTRFRFDWHGEVALGVTDFAYVVPINTNVLDPIVVLNEMMSSIAKGASLYLKVISGAVNSDGQIIITSGAKPETKPASKFNQGPFTISIAGSGNGYTNGANKSIYGTGEASFIYSSDKVRLILDGDLVLQENSIPTGTGSISAKNTGLEAKALAAYSVKPRWSVALIGRTRQNHGQNVATSRTAITGLEWSLVPFRTNETREVFVRVGGGIQDLDLIAENDLGYLREQYSLLFAQVSANWTLMDSKVKFAVQGFAETFPKHLGYEIYGGSATLFYSINSVIQVNGSYSLFYKEKSLTFPNAPDFSNPVQSTFLSGAPGMTTSFSLGLNITFGNPFRKSSDRRWADF